MFLCLFTGKSRANDFVLDSIDLTDAVFEQCTTCDARSDRAGNRAVAGALREYMTRNHVQILLAKGLLCIFKTWLMKVISYSSGI